MLQSITVPILMAVAPLAPEMFLLSSPSPASLNLLGTAASLCFCSGCLLAAAGHLCRLIPLSGLL